MTIPTTFQLRIKQVNHICDFELTWGHGRSLSAELQYPEAQMKSLYQDWQQIYLKYYRQLRGKLKDIGTVEEPQVDLRSHLVQAERALLDRFHYWLKQPDLEEIRQQISEAAQGLPDGGHAWIDIFLNCSSSLARLPWESWEIGTDRQINQNIRIARRPQTVKQKPVTPLRRKARVLVIMGDDTGLDLRGDLEATLSLTQTTNIEVVGWKPGKDAAQLKHEIVEAIADPRGWDVLLFAGHSNETALTGGKLGIAPRTSMHVSELQESLKVAQGNGLQFALFNSCEGIGIAKSLIELGLSQVVVMREPIHNRVAQDFLKQFLVSLAAYKDVHESLLEACEGLQQQAYRLDAPSAYLVPSLYRHPEAEVFRIQPFGVWQHVQRWKPTRVEVRWIAALVLLSLLPPIQDLLMEPRILLQAIYRQVTLQLPKSDKPPVLMVSIDEMSLEQDGVKLVYDRYLDYGYLGRLIDALSERQAKVIGIDYVLDKEQTQPDKAKVLKGAIDRAIENQSWVVFAAEGENTVSPSLANLQGSLEGDVGMYHWYLELFSREKDCLIDRCPFGYLLSWSQALREGGTAFSYAGKLIGDGFDGGLETLHSPPCPPSLGGAETVFVSRIERLSTQSPPVLGDLGGECKRNSDVLSSNVQLLSQQSPSDFRASVLNAPTQDNSQLKFLRKLRLHPWSTTALMFGQRWGVPILDFSVPENRVAQRVSACEVLGSCEGRGTLPERLDDQVVLIVQGGYEQGGLLVPGDDNYRLPLALAFWQGEQGWKSLVEGEDQFTGGEAHAYMIHHLLRKHLVFPVPDFCLTLVMAMVGKGIQLLVWEYPKRRKTLLRGVRIGSIAYFVASLQIYITGGVLWPVGLPLVMLGRYMR